MTLLGFMKKAFFGLLLLYGLISMIAYYRRASDESADSLLQIDKLAVKYTFDKIEHSRLFCPSTCPSLIDGKPVNYSNCPQREDENDHKRFASLLKDCPAFLEKGGFILHSMTKEEADFPLAFSLLVYCCPNQIELLLRAIYRPQNYYCIHVDSKAHESFKICMYSLANCFPNVFVAQRMEVVRWGTLGVVNAELACMRELLRFKRWKYFINLTGQEFPLKTNLEIVRILKALNGANDINANIVPGKRFRIEHIYRDDGTVLGPNGPVPFNMTVLSGSTHISATRDFVDFLINDPKVKVYLDWLNGTKIPDETVFSMLNGNPQLGVPGSYKGSLEAIHHLPFISRYKVWQDDRNGFCGGFFRRSVCVFGMQDLPRLVNMIELFANKFTGLKPDYFVTRRCLDEWHFNRTRDEYLGRFIFNFRPYESLPQSYP